MVEAGSNCNSCNSVFKIAYETCPICELSSEFELSQFESKSEIREKAQNHKAEFSPSTRRYLGL